MSTRAALYVGGSLFAAAVALAAVGMWLPVGLLVAVCTYVAGRWDRDRRVAELTAELTAVKARERRLDDELNDLHHARFGQVHNGAGHLSPAALNDRNSNTTADRGVPAQVRADFLP